MAEGDVFLIAIGVQLSLRHRRNERGGGQAHVENIASVTEEVQIDRDRGGVLNNGPGNGKELIPAEAGAGTVGTSIDTSAVIDMEIPGRGTTLRAVVNCSAEGDGLALPQRQLGRGDVVGECFLSGYPLTKQKRAFAARVDGRCRSSSGAPVVDRG